jgi:hypothetical protein
MTLQRPEHLKSNQQEHDVGIKEIDRASTGFL